MIKTLNFRPLSHTSALRKIVITSMLSATVAMSGCSLLSVYKIDLPQGPEAKSGYESKPSSLYSWQPCDSRYS